MENPDKIIFKKILHFRKDFDSVIGLIEKKIAENIVNKKNNENLKKDLDLIKSHINDTETKLHDIKNNLD